MEDFEEILSNMSKPDLPDLKHEQLLSEAIINAKDKTVVSLWWLSIPLYIVAALLMKSYFKRDESFHTILHEVTNKNDYSTLLLFIVMPFLVIIINALSIKKIYYLSGSPKLADFLGIIFWQIILIVLSLFIFIIYWI